LLDELLWDGNTSSRKWADESGHCVVKTNSVMGAEGKHWDGECIGIGELEIFEQKRTIARGHHTAERGLWTVGE
jgi:hypothetical protein